MWTNKWGISEDRLVHNLRYSRFSYDSLKTLEVNLWAEFRFYRGESENYRESLDTVLQEVKQELRVRDDWTIVFTRK